MQVVDEDLHYVQAGASTPFRSTKMWSSLCTRFALLPDLHLDLDVKHRTCMVEALRRSKAMLS